MSVIGERASAFKSSDEIDAIEKRLLDEDAKARGYERSDSGKTGFVTVSKYLSENSDSAEDYSEPRPQSATIIRFVPRVKASLTVIENSEGLATKIFSVKDGKVHKQSAAQICKGEARRIEIADIEDLVPLMDSLTKNEAIMCGVFAQDHVQVVTQANLNGPETVARDRAHTSYRTGDSGLLPLDFDPLPGELPLSPAEADQLITEVWPEWGQAARLWRPSASAAAVTGRPARLRAGSGRFAYSTDRRRAVCVYGSRDMAASSSAVSHNCLSAPSSISPCFSRKGCFTASPQRKAFKEKIRKDVVARCLSVKEATLDKAVEELEDQEIPTFVLEADFPIKLPKNEGYITAGEMRANPDKWDRKRLPDPLEPDYANDPRIAVAYLKQPTPVIYSHAHGGMTYRLLKTNPKPEPEPEPDPDDAPAFKPSPFKWTEPAQIPPRPWIYGNHYIRRQAQATIAASKVGKTGLLIIEALSIASGKALLGILPRERCKVWYWNGEDDRDELQRRFTAAMIEYGIEPEDVEGWLFVDNGREMGITIAELTKHGVQIAIAVEKDIIDQLKALDIGVLIIDPFISCHRVPENDNIAIDTVAKTWARIAGKANCAVELAHHIRKPSGSAGGVTVDDARGGGSLIAAVRTARTMARMTKTEAEKAAITSEQERKSIFRIDDAGGNLAPASDAVDWHKFHNVELADGVGVVKTWKFPSVFKENASGDLLAVQKAIHKGEWRESSQAKNWAGNAVADALNLDLKDNGARDRVKSMLAVWIKNKALKVVSHLDKKRMSRNWIEVGEWAHEPGPAASTQDYSDASGNSGHKTVYEPDEIPPDIRKKARKK